MTQETDWKPRGMDDRRTGLLRRDRHSRRVGNRRARGTGSHRWTGQSRRGTDRRAEVRRALFDRRQARRRDDALSPFTAEEVDRVQRMFTRPGVTRTCPACRASFSLGPPRRKKADTLRRVLCKGCGRATVVTNSLPARILIVEPVEAARASVLPILLEAGHEVVEAVDVDQGLGAYRAVASDVVIVDVSEGTGIGPRFISRLRDEFPSAAVVALSRRTSYGVGDRSSVASYFGAVTVRRMPCSPAEMLESIETARKTEI